MKWLFVAFLVVAGVVLTVTAIGVLLPKGHVASRRVRLSASPETIWKLITDVEAFPTWRTDVEHVERLPDRAGRQVWVEEGSSGRITLAVDRMEPPRLVVVRIADPDLPFGGTWTYEIAGAGAATTLSITEHGEVYNPIFRFAARFVFGHDATIARYLDALQKKTALQASAEAE